MKTITSSLWKMTQGGLCIAMLIVIILQFCELTAHAGDHNLAVRWGTTTSWTGDHATVTTTAYTLASGSSYIYAHNATPVFTITPASGYRVDSVQSNDGTGVFTPGNGNDLSPNSNGTYTFNMPNKDCSLQINIVPHVVNIRWGTTSSFTGDGGSVIFSSGTTITTKNSFQVDTGTTQTFTITPLSGYRINSVEWKSYASGGFSSGGTSLTPNSSNQVSFTMTGSDCSLQVTFEQITYHNAYIRWGTTTSGTGSWSGDGGTVTSTVYSITTKNSYSYATNSNPVFTITPNPGYMISSLEWKNNTGSGFNVGSGTTLTPDGSGNVTFTLPSQDCSLQVVFVIIPNHNVFVRWGTTTSGSGAWSGDGGSVTSSGRTVSNRGNTPFSGFDWPVFTITPSPGYIISSVQWKDNDNNGFNAGSGTDLTPNGSKQVTFQMTNQDCSLQVVFDVDPLAALGDIVAYYGTGAIDVTAQTVPNWIGGTVYRKSTATGNLTQLGTSAYLTYSSTNSNDKMIHITPGTSPNYQITAVQYCVATWHVPSAVTVIGTPTPVTADGNGEFTFSFDPSKSYIVFVQFTLIGAQGGHIGAWYGTNNTLDYDASTASPPGANGSGGTIWKTSPGLFAEQLTNRVANGVTISTNTSVTVEVRPATNFKITSIHYGDTTPTSSVAVTDPQTTNVSFTFNVANGHNYVVWVVFTSTAATSFTVSGTVDPATDASCTSNTITPPSQVINTGDTGTFIFSTSSNCMIDSVNFCPGGTCGGPQAWVGSGSTYTTPAITATSSFVVKYKPIGFNIISEIDTSSPTGCGTISPVGTTSVVRAANQTYVISSATNCAISHVWVTDTNRGYTTDTDIAPLSMPSYTFSNVQAAGHIKVLFTSIVPTSSDAYCQIPPFVIGQTGLAPNVLIIFDNSGSMGGNDTDGYTYYNIKTYDCTSGSTAGSCSTFTGYFDETKMYITEHDKYGSGDSNKYLINPVTLNLANNGLSGNYLNYRNMHKVDLIRKALTGGKIVDRTVTPTTDPLTHYFLATDSGKKVQYGTTLPTGIIQNLAGRVRFGIMVFNDPPEGGHLATVPNSGTPARKAVLGSSLVDLIAAVESSQTDPLTSTPIAETLYEAIRYFQAKPSAYNSGVDYGTMDPIQNTCQKNFILLLTDGEPNSNNNLPGLSTHPTMNGYTDSVFDINVWENRIPDADKASTTTSSTCTYPPASTVHTVTYGSSVNSEKVEAVAFYMHNTDLRSAAYGNSIEGTQNITLFPVYAFGNGSGTKTLQKAAKYGGYENSNGNLPSPNTWPSPDLQSEWESKANTCVPYNYFEADNGTALENSINSALTTILAKVSSGTAASILSNSEGSGANMLQAVFYPNKIWQNSTQVNWSGEMQNLWYYVDPFIDKSTVREDTDFATTTPDHLLNLKNDYITKFFFDTGQTTTRVSRTEDTNGDGSLLTLIDASIDPDAVKSIWRAGKNLWARTADSRTIHTSLNGTSLLSYADTKGGFYSDATRAAALQTYLQAADNDSNAEAMKIINYIRGTDQTSYRNRKVSLTISTTVPPPDLKEWKLGDIIASTPRIQSTSKMNGYDAAPLQGGYSDMSYKSFVSSANYGNRGMVYVGANDGMLHAFKMGKLTVRGSTITGLNKATLTGTNLGEEQWAYIPRNALPYLKYFTDRDNYKHLYFVDGPTALSDVAIAKPSGCSASDYSDCAKDAALGTNWATVLIGSMGLGGASSIKATSPCTDGADGTCVKTPLYSDTDINNVPHLGLGYSSYFAFDITGQYFDSSGVLVNQPTLKWEFSHPNLGYATSGAAIVKISARTTVAGVASPDKSKNGKWFAVFASGPTGPIDTVAHSFLARSDQNLRLFVVDLGAVTDATHPLVLNTSYWVIDTQIKRAFGGGVMGNVFDADRSNFKADGNYQDDALYVGYTKANIDDSDSINPATTKWTDGGVIRLLTKEDPDPSHWVVSPVISGVGPVTTGIAKLQDVKNHKLWLYFGTGRYYYSGDDPSSQRYLIGVQDRCYTSSNTIDPNCDTTAAAGPDPEATGKGKVLVLNDNTSILSDLQNVTNNFTATITKKGWYIKLDPEDTTISLGSERSVTDPVAQTNGSVFFTTFEPTSDVCKFGGNSYVWGVTYDGGGTLPDAALKGKVLVQVSTGSFEEVSLKTALTASGNRKMGSPMVGKPPAPAPPIVSNADLKPVKRIVHIRER